MSTSSLAGRGWRSEPNHPRSSNKKNKGNRDTKEEKPSNIDEWKAPRDTSKIETGLTAAVAKEKLEEDIESIFRKYDSNVVTTHDAADHLECSPDVAKSILEILRKDKRLSKRRSAGTELWRLRDASRLEETSPNDLPEGLREIVAFHKDPEESVEEAYKRIRGNPSPGILRDIMGESNSEFIDRVRRAIDDRDEVANESKDRLWKRF